MYYYVLRRITCSVVARRTREISHRGGRGDVDLREASARSARAFSDFKEERSSHRYDRRLRSHVSVKWRHSDKCASSTVSGNFTFPECRYYRARVQPLPLVCILTARDLQKMQSRTTTFTTNFYLLEMFSHLGKEYHAVTSEMPRIFI